MHEIELYSYEEAASQAYEIFLELAPDNLKSQDIEDFNQQREELGFIEESEPDELWQDIVEFEIDPQYYVQVLIGLEFENQDLLFARILISLDKENPYCHVVWKP